MAHRQWCRSLKGWQDCDEDLTRRREDAKDLLYLQHSTRFRFSVNSFFDYGLTVDQNVFDSYWKLFGLRKRCAIGDCLFIEDHDIGCHSWPQNSSIPQLERLSWQRCHFPHSLFQPDDSLLTDVTGKQTRVVAKSSWMRNTVAREVNNTSVGRLASSIDPDPRRCVSAATSLDLIELKSDELT